MRWLLSQITEVVWSAQRSTRTTGTLTYTPAPNANGSATITLV